MSWLGGVLMVVMAFNLVFFGILLAVYGLEKWRRRRR